MKITTKELKLQPGKIIQNVATGKEVIVTFRGQAVAKIVPLEQVDEPATIFGLWKDDIETENVGTYVREIRKPRNLC